MKIIPYKRPAVSGEVLWQKISSAAGRLSRETVEKVLWLYYASRRPETPKWAKTLIYSTLAYFILPLDAIPDFIPITGYTDDLGAIGTALATLAMYVDDDVKRKTSAKLQRWFRKSEPELDNESEQAIASSVNQDELALSAKSDRNRCA